MADEENQTPPAEGEQEAAAGDNTAIMDEAQAIGGVDDAADINLDAISDIPVEISAVLGQTTMPISQLMKLGRGAVIKLDRKIGEAVDIYVNNRLIARGEVVLVENRIGVTMTEVIKSDRE